MEMHAHCLQKTNRMTHFWALLCFPSSHTPEPCSHAVLKIILSV